LIFNKFFTKTGKNKSVKTGKLNLVLTPDVAYDVREVHESLINREYSIASETNLHSVLPCDNGSKIYAEG